MKLTDTLTLPPDTVTRTLAILAQKGKGKTYCAMKLTELLLNEQRQVVALDPTGVWWGLRTGFDILIMGGPHGDVPLEPTAGEIVAEFVVSTGRSVVLDLSLFESKGAQNRFTCAFAERLYRLKAKTEHRTPLHLMLDEADQFTPQRPQKGEERLLGAFEAIVRLGRSRGLGMTLISQRAAVVNKNVLTQVDALLCLGTTGKQDLDAVHGWIKHYLHTKEQAAEFLTTLPKLAVGEMWFWSPGWLGAFQRGKVLPRTTFDSSSTPDATTPTPTVALRPVDLSALTEAIAASVEKAKENDPRELKAEIARLKTEVSRLQQAQPEIKTVTKEVPVLGGSFTEMKDRMQSLQADLANVLEQLRHTQTRLDHVAPLPPVEHFRGILARPEASPQAPIPKTKAAPFSTKLAKAERAILTVLAQHEGQACTKSKIAAIAGYAVNGGGFNNAVSALRSAGYIRGSDPLDITAEGRAALGPFDPLPTGRESINHWIRELPKCEGLILTALLDTPGHFLDKADLANHTGYEVTGGGFNNALSNLRTRELITGRGPITLILP